MSDDVLVELEGLLPDLPRALEHRRLGESLGRTASALRDWPRQESRLTALLEQGEETGFGANPQQVQVKQNALDAAAEAAAAMIEAATAEDLRDVNELYSNLRQPLASLEAVITTHWRSIVDTEFRPLSVIGGLLERIDDTSDLGHRLSACGREAEASTRAPSAEALRDAVQRLRRTRAALEEERRSLTGEPEVDRFLDAVARGGAALRMETPAVRAWIEAHDAMNIFVVRVAG
ncbi:hypothetical protein WDZ92_33150 [Nostoc sp. NIES-2111]